MRLSVTFSLTLTQDPGRPAPATAMTPAPPASPSPVAPQGKAPSRSPIAELVRLGCVEAAAEIALLATSGHPWLTMAIRLAVFSLLCWLAWHPRL